MVGHGHLWAATGADKSPSIAHRPHPAVASVRPTRASPRAAGPRQIQQMPSGARARREDDRCLEPLKPPPNPRHSRRPPHLVPSRRLTLKMPAAQGACVPAFFTGESYRTAPLGGAGWSHTLSFAPRLL